MNDDLFDMIDRACYLVSAALSIFIVGVVFGWYMTRTFGG